MKKTYAAEVSTGIGRPKAVKETARKAKDADKVRFCLKQRGLGGQIVCHPSPGCKMVYNDLCSISEITPEERKGYATRNCPTI